MFYRELYQIVQELKICVESRTSVYKGRKKSESNTKVLIIARVQQIWRLKL